jgi:DNA-binding MarR family transcriptional regulator
MSQEEPGPDLDEGRGLRPQAGGSGLRAALDAVLRPLELTVPQYACLEVLAQRPGLSNAELARATFVTRQSMNVVLRGLQDRGLVSRPSTARTAGPATQITASGRQHLQSASAAVRAVERRMLAPLPEARGDGCARIWPPARRRSQKPAPCRADISVALDRRCRWTGCVR